MNSEPTPESVLQRLELNTRLSDIPVAKADIEGMLERNFFSTVIAFEKIVSHVPNEINPDYLKDWDLPIPAKNESPTQSTITPPRKKLPNGGEALSLAEIAAGIRNRAISPVELTRQCLERVTTRGVELNAFQLVLTDRAVEAARQAEIEIAAGEYRGPLHGVPLAVKDLLAMKGTLTTAGSKILAENLTNYDSAAVERLEKAGAVIVGKTRMSEFAYSPGSNNGHYGPTRNPWNTEHDTGGSSSGSGAAVAEGLVYGALGTDTGGSIRIPAAFCGIIGLKPTYGRTSLYGGFTLSWSSDHLGPMANTVEDVALMLEVLAGYDPRDSRTRPNSDWKRASVDLDGGVKGLRVGVVRDSHAGDFATPEMMAAWKAGLAELERNGAELVDLDIPFWSHLWTINGAIIGLEATTLHLPWLRERLNDFSDFMRHRVLASFSYKPQAYVQAQQARAYYRHKLNTIWEKVDLISTPAMPAPAPALGSVPSTLMTGPLNLLGWPALSMPFGFNSVRLPLSLQLAAKPWDEATVLRAAKVLEAAGYDRTF